MAGKPAPPAIKHVTIRGLAVFGLFVVALLLRVCFVYTEVFAGTYVNFQGSDPWYHVRAVEHLIYNFPFRLTFDPYALFPGGQHVGVAPLYDLILGASALVGGAGSPSLELTHAVCAWAPAILGALVTIPVYFIGTYVKDARAGLFAAALIAVMPGPFLRRSLLGFADHHVAECLFSLLTMLFLLRALRLGEENAPGSAARGRRSNFPNVVQNALVALPAGFFLGCYLLTWVGGSLFVLVILLALGTQLVVGHSSGRSNATIAIVAPGACIVALLMVLPFHEIPGFRHHIISLVATATVLPIAAGLSRLVRSRGGSYVVFIVCVIAVCAGGVAMLWLIVPSSLAEAAWALRWFIGGEGGRQVIEASRLLYSGDAFTLGPLWELFQTNIISAMIALVVLSVVTIRRGRPEATLLVIWTVLIALATLSQRRFAYYLAANVAILSGYLWSTFLDTMGRRGLTRLPRRTVTAAALGYLAFLLAGLLPSAVTAYTVAHDHTGPHADWQAAMVWLRNNSPEPFGDPEYYFSSYDAPGRSGSFVLPSSAYGIMNWWDHGYWISTLGHRIPTANPTQAGAREAAECFTAQDESTASNLMDSLGARYVVIDGTLPVWEESESGKLIGKFHSMIEWTGRDPSDFFEVYFIPNEDGSLSPMTLYYPEYYRSMLNRLYIFGGRGAGDANNAWGVRFTEIEDTYGNRAKKIEQTVRFSNYAAARQFVERQESHHWRIVGLTHAHSCVPLEPLSRFKLAYQSPQTTASTDTRQISFVEIFEYTARK